MSGFQVVDNIGVVPTIFSSMVLIKTVIRRLFVVITLFVCLNRYASGSQLGAVWLPRGNVTISGDTFGCHHWGGVLWHLVG